MPAKLSHIHTQYNMMGRFTSPVAESARIGIAHTHNVAQMVPEGIMTSVEADD